MAFREVQEPPPIQVQVEQRALAFDALRDAINGVLVCGLSFQDEPWWSELDALHKKLAPRLPELTYPKQGMLGSKEEATASAAQIVEAGGFAWVQPEYGNDMGHENVFWGYRVYYFDVRPSQPKED